jgi:hypothetical protein
MQALNPSTITLLVVAPLLIWRLYSRIRRMVGRQRLSRVRPWITVILFPLLVLLLTSAAYVRPERLLWLAGGLASGAVLAVYGLRRTQFEATSQGLFYTPHAHLGIALSLLLVGRILYRLIQVYYLGSMAPSGTSDFARSPATLAVFGILAGYYIAYAVGLLRWRHREIGAKGREAKASSGAA